MPAWSATIKINVYSQNFQIDNHKK